MCWKTRFTIGAKILLLLLVFLATKDLVGQEDLTYQRTITQYFTANKTIVSKKYRIPIYQTEIANPDTIAISLYGQWSHSSFGRVFDPLDSIFTLSQIGSTLSAEEALTNSLQYFPLIVGSIALSSIMTMDNVQWRTYTIAIPVAGQYHFVASLKGHWATKPANIVKLFNPDGAALINETVVLDSDATRNYWISLSPGIYVFQVGLGRGSVQFATAGNLADVLLDDTQTRTWLIPACLLQEFTIRNFPDTIPNIGGVYHFNVPFSPFADMRQLDPNGSISYSNVTAHMPFLNELDMATRYIIVDPPLDGGPLTAGSYFTNTIQADATINGFSWNGAVSSFNVIRNENLNIQIEVVKTTVAP